jgi:aryl carrier-like protein
VAYFTVDAGAVVEIEQMRARLSKVLPEHMIPVAYVVLDAFPLTPNGKLNRKILPAPESGSYALRAYEPPVGEIETALAQIWSEVLKVERVGRHDDFFALGGHSLLAVSLLERMRRADLHADVRTLFTTATLAELAAATEKDILL